MKHLQSLECSGFGFALEERFLEGGCWAEVEIIHFILWKNHSEELRIMRRSLYQLPIAKWNYTKTAGLKQEFISLILVCWLVRSSAGLACPHPVMSSWWVRWWVDSGNGWASLSLFLSSAIFREVRQDSFMEVEPFQQGQPQIPSLLTSHWPKQATRPIPGSVWVRTTIGIQMHEGQIHWKSFLLQSDTGAKSGNRREQLGAPTIVRKKRWWIAPGWWQWEF